MKFLILLSLYFLIEVKVTTVAGLYLGSFLTSIEIIASMIIGVFIFSNFKHSLYDTLVSLSQRKMSKEKAIALNIGLLISGILLFLPGIFSDIIGVLIQAYFFQNIWQIKNQDNNETGSFKDEDIIDTKHTIDEHGDFVFIADQNRKEDN